MDRDVRDVLILGSGPAGLTAAVYSARANLHPLVIEGEPSSTSDQPGGQLMLTTDVENYPGFVDGILGPELMGRMRAQAERFGAEYLTSRVTRVEFSTPTASGSRSGPHRVWALDPATGQEIELRARAVIVATGARSLMLGLEGESRLMGHGVSTCATCDGFFFRDQPIAVVGGGDSALEEAIFLTKFADEVTVIHRRKELRASKIMQDRAFTNPKLTFRWDSVVTEILGDGRVEGVRLRNVVTAETDVLPVSGLFIAIGHAPNTGLFHGQLEMDDAGYLVTTEGTKTNVEGVFVCGDVQDHVYRQAVTAAGTGCMAAIDAERWLETLGDEAPTEALTQAESVSAERRAG